ncbi:MAG TPA: hypothetical protein VI386_13940 [Candidatus Sulfotelmatobacter sp.]
MSERKLLLVLIAISIVFAFVLSSVDLIWAQAKGKVLYRFQGGTVDGQYPSGQLLLGPDGSLYGATPYGGGIGNCDYNGHVAYCGTIFHLTSKADGSWKESVIYRFTGGADGGVPDDAPVFDKLGNLYGAAAVGGDVSNCETGTGCGTIFELKPGNSGWILSTLFTFDTDSDIFPRGSLIFDPAGNLYGMARDSVFELSPNKQRGWWQTVLYTFNTNESPLGGVVRDASGNLYGAFNSGAFELSPGTGGWTETNIATSLNSFGGLTADGNGNLYGTDDGPPGGGHVFELTRTSTGWQQSTIYQFQGAPDGSIPFGKLAVDSTGNIYGATVYGGTAHCQNVTGTTQGCGTIFKLSPSTTGWTETVLYSFPGGPQGYYPEGGVVLDNDDNVYGTTLVGGGSICRVFRGTIPGNGCGVVFEVIP